MSETSFSVVCRHCNYAWASRSEYPNHCARCRRRLPVLQPYEDDREWRAVIGYEGLYEISADGQVRRIGSYVRAQGRLRKTKLNRDGYVKITLNKGNVMKDHSMHALVAAAFMGPRPQSHDVNHIDGNKQNNHVTNLEYITTGDNIRHAYTTGLRVPWQHKRALSV